MLINLSIQNIAVIEKADAEFSDGFNILTGETGAGKSLLIDSLSMVLGMRTSRDLIRQGAEGAFVSALFSSSVSLSEFDIEDEEDGTILLSRKLSADGKNICKINSHTVPLSTLRQLGERLVTIHGQNDNISLLKPSYHLSLIDEYAKCHALLDDYKAAYNDYVDSLSKLIQTRTDESEREIQKDMLTFKINEIRQVEPVVGEDEELCEKRDALRNFSSILSLLESARDALSGTGGARDALYSAMRNLENASSMDKSLSPVSEQLTDLYYNAEDIASSITSITSKMTFSPQELDMVEERLDCLTRLKKKYGPEISDCLNNLANWENELEELVFYDDTILKLEKTVDEHKEKMLTLGESLHKARVEASARLKASIEEELSFLDMPKVRFDVAFTPHDPSPTGLYSAEFLISTSPSEDLKPLSRIASGGEMSRIMLALKSALSDCDSVEVLLFDEIDTGVSGKAAVKIAEKLKALSENKQIICITHLPQLAARAHTHLLVQKDTSTDLFRARVTNLDRTGRINELARLISGDSENPASRNAAEEMLDI